MASAALAHGAYVYVSTNGNDATGSGLNNWGNAVLTISQGVTKVTSSSDIVLVSNGTYNLAAMVIVPTGITVQGFAGRDNTVTL